MGRGGNMGDEESGEAEEEETADELEAFFCHIFGFLQALPYLTLRVQQQINK